MKKILFPSASITLVLAACLATVPALAAEQQGVSKNEIVIMAFARKTFCPWNFLITPPLAKKTHPATAYRRNLGSGFLTSC
jgi:hypothetical protein